MWIFSFMSSPVSARPSLRFVSSLVCPSVECDDVGGDGNKRMTLEQMLYEEDLTDRVEMLGGVEPSEAHNVYVSINFGS